MTLRGGYDHRDAEGFIKLNALRLRWPRARSPVRGRGVAESLKHVILRLAEGRRGDVFTDRSRHGPAPAPPDEVKGEESGGFLRQVRAGPRSARQERIDILRRGGQDPSKPIKGLIQLRKTPGSPPFDPDED